MNNIRERASLPVYKGTSPSKVFRSFFFFSLFARNGQEKEGNTFLKIYIYILEYRPPGSSSMVIIILIGTGGWCFSFKKSCLVVVTIAAAGSPTGAPQPRAARTSRERWDSCVICLRDRSA